jgi:hypothetical protein
MQYIYSLRLFKKLCLAAILDVSMATIGQNDIIPHFFTS